MQPEHTVACFELAVDDVAGVVAGQRAGTEPEDAGQIVVRRFEVGVDEDRDSPLHTGVDSCHVFQHLQKVVAPG